MERTLMNIEMIGNKGADHVNDMEITYSKPSLPASGKMTEKMGFSLDITGKVRENAAYGKEELRSAEEIAQIAGMTDVSLQSDYMAVMSNSMSDEDFAELVKDGVNPTKIPAGEVVTNLDKIKIRMAEAGTTIAGYNDDLSEDDIKAVLGNSINAGKIIADTLRASDLPDTRDNVAAVKETVMMAQNLKPLSDDAISYMVSEDLPPTIENLYKAEYSAAAKGFSSNGVHFEGAATYAGSELTMSSWDDLKDQALEVIRQAGIADEETALSDAKQIASYELPITKETLKAYAEVKDIELPAKPQDLVAAMTVAIEEGKSPKEAVITDTKSIFVRAAETVETFMNMEDPADITRRRQLEEVRLVMTKEANLMLMRKGINIETEPLEKLVEELKAAEREFYAPLLKNEEAAGGNEEAQIKDLDDKIDLYKQTRQVIDTIPHVPVRVIAEKTAAGELNLEAIARDGGVARAAYEKAGEAYEALMTAPRADMGDSIRKAFRNVDDILTDLDMDVNDGNRKAVRTLGYAGMMINRESVDEVRDATAAVSRVVSLMTPAKTLSMIREGHNPLRENIFELEKSLSQETFDESEEKYSKFLWKMEKSGNITEDEKQAFIGMYRLFNTIEKKDGKVIGNVLASGEELTLENMLKASRSNRHTNEEYVIDDDFGFLEKLIERGDSITAQIDAAFVKLLDPAPEKDYIREKQRDIRLAEKTGDEEAILSLIEEPVTVESVLAASAMTGGMGKGYKKMFGNGNTSEDDRREGRGEALTDEDADKLTEAFTDRESAQKAYEAFIDRAREVARSNTLTADSYEDVRAFSMLYKQVGFASSLAGYSSYEVPVKLEDGWTSIHLTIIHSGDESGKVRATFDSEGYGKVDATFTLKQTGVDGFIVSDSRAGVDNLKAIDDKIKEGFQKEDLETANLSYVFSATGSRERYIPQTEKADVSNSRLYTMAKAFISAVSVA